MATDLKIDFLNISSDERETHTRDVQQIISDWQYELLILISTDIISTSICICGIITNFMNIIVFVKQGFENSMNISFLGLAVSDLCCIITLFGVIVCLSPWFLKLDLDISPTEFAHLTSGIPHISFIRITGWITVFVTAERCLCIMFPLKIKQIITPKVTTITVSIIYSGVIVSIFPEYLTAYIDWKFYPDINKTLLGMVFTSDSNEIEELMFIVNAFFGLACFIAVIIFTLVLILKLKHKSSFRRQANIDKARSQSISSRDRRTMIMVVMIAIVLIVSYTPGIIICLTASVISEFNALGVQSKMFFCAWSIGCTMQAVNSSVNIVIYYKMSTKYRETFNEVFHITKTTATP